MRQLIHLAAAIIVIGVFTSLPTLVRIQDRLSGSDAPTAFRISKNFERPHETRIAPAAVPAAAASVRADASPVGDAFGSHDVLSNALLRFVATLRAPPVA